jgi:hypothetical protein
VAQHPGRWGSGALPPPAVDSLVESHCAMFMSAGTFGPKLLRSLDLKLGRKSILKQKPHIMIEVTGRPNGWHVNPAKVLLTAELKLLNPDVKWHTKRLLIHYSAN